MKSSKNQQKKFLKKVLTFNFMKGVGNNPEVTLFIPVGIAILLAILIIDILIIV